MKSRMRENRTYGSVRGSDIPSQVEILERSVELSTRRMEKARIEHFILNTGFDRPLLWEDVSCCSDQDLHLILIVALKGFQKRFL